MHEKRGYINSFDALLNIDLCMQNFNVNDVNMR